MMTPALKAMVEAMGRELERQASEGGRELWVCEIGSGPEWAIEGRYDLEKVARAGLEAIREPTLAQTNAGWAAIRADLEARGVDLSGMRDVGLVNIEAPTKACRAMIDAILTPTTGERDDA